MASTPSSQSEGEIFTSDSEKATKSLPSYNGTSVDRHTRTHASAPRSPAVRSHRSRSRSRSPYRASRGEKRRRDDERSREELDPDPRRFSVRYEERRFDDRDRRPGSYGDLDPKHTKRSYLHYDDEYDRRTHSKRPKTRSRSRSRSPYRHTRKTQASTQRDPSDGSGLGGTRNRQEQGHRGLVNNGKPRSEQSVSERGKPSGFARSSKTHAETRGYQNSRDNSKPSSSPLTDTDRNDESQTTPQGLDELSLIEERRKRREAIKAKYRGHATPLLVQALRLGGEAGKAGSSADTTRGPSRQSESPGPTSPQTPKDASGLQSPAELDIVKDEDLANANAENATDGEYEPSAADYDPTVDMREERIRHEKSLFHEDQSTSEKIADEVANQILKVNDTIQQAPVTKKSTDAFDMFAEEDDDELDMFAPEPPKAVEKAPPETKVAQALDVSMMDNWDDSEGYYITMLGELIQGRYHVHQNLGRGMFSSVVRATDAKTSGIVAIKIIRNRDAMRKAGIKEIEILKDLAINDPEDKKHIIRLVGSFDHKGHLCMVFENLSLNLREVLKKFGRDVGINLKAIRAYAQQLFLGLSLLKKCQYLHADLKPDNILVNESRNILKVCDLGSASTITEAMTAPYLVSRFYRAPELMLGISYDYGIDVWSVGCTLFELYTGKILFTGRNNNAMLRSIMECRGKFPHKLLRKGTLTYQHFDDLLNFQAVEEDKLTGRMVTKSMEIKTKPVRDLRSRLVPKGKKMDESEKKELELFLDLLEKCLDLRGEKRITPHDALKHSFILRGR